MKEYLIAGFVVTLILTSTLAIAQEELVKPRVFPDSPIYPIKKFIEKIWIWISFDPELRAKTRLGFAEYRLAEAKAMIEKGKLEFLEELKVEYEKEMNESEKEVNKMVALGRDVTTLAEYIAKVTQKHLRVLENLLEKVPEVAQPHILHAINVSARRYFIAVEKISDTKPGLAGEFVINFTQERMEKAKEFIESGKEKFAKIILEKYEEGLDEAERVQKRGEALGRNVTILAEHVCNMTYKHIGFLQKILENISEEAKPAIEHAINSSLDKHMICKERIMVRINKTLEKVRGIECKVHEDCFKIICPMAIGMDTPLCKEIAPGIKRCVCGPKWELWK
jgi:hypothetical protein